MDERHYWNEFFQSGNIQSYLSYKKHQAERSENQWESQNYEELY